MWRRLQMFALNLVTVTALGGCLAAAALPAGGYAAYQSKQRAKYGTGIPGGHPYSSLAYEDTAAWTCKPAVQVGCLACKNVSTMPQAIILRASLNSRLWGAEKEERMTTQPGNGVLQCAGTLYAVDQ